MISLGIISIPAKYNVLNFTVGPVENEKLFVRSWEGVEATYFAVMDNWKCCPNTYQYCGVCALVSAMRSQPLAEVVESLDSVS